MMNFWNKNKYFFALLLVTLTAICVTFQHNIGLIIDCGREVYYPQEILNGKILYKDLFNNFTKYRF